MKRMNVRPYNLDTIKPDLKQGIEKPAISYEITNPLALLVYDKTSRNILLSKQHRFITYAITVPMADLLEVFMGSIKSTEEQIAVDMLLKKTGVEITGNEIESIGNYYFSVSGNLNLIKLYYIEIELPKNYNPVEYSNEFNEIVLFTRNEVDEMLANNQIVDGKTATVLYWWLNRKAR